MPATYGGKDADGFVLGVDGCRAGWIAVRLELSSGATQAFFTSNFKELFTEHGASARIVIVDMPIGLAVSGRRVCEQQARKLLSPLRHNSVFSTPRRPMLGFDEYAEANEWGKRQGTAAGGGLSKQAWSIMPKIREIDETITPDDQHRLAEGHPEVAFWRLNGGQPCRHPKRKPEGAQERLVLLRDHGITFAEQHFQALKAKLGPGVARDDVYDACALALTAQARLKGNALQLGDGVTDARGLKMEIWG